MFPLSPGLSQETRLAQHQVMAPQMRRNLALLQAPRMELSRLLREAADVNPALVVDDPGTVSLDAAREKDAADAAEPAADEEPADPDFGVLGELGSDADDLYSAGGNNEYDPDADERRQFFFDSIPATESLQQHLTAQLDERDLTPEDRALAEQIVGSVDSAGRLETPLADIAQASFRPLADAERMLAVVQGFSPLGVGARDLRECLEIQLRADPRSAGSAALRLVSDPEAFALLEKRDYRAIAARLGIPEAGVAAAVRDLAALDPAPGRAYAQARTEWVRPEIVVRETEDGRFEAFLDEDETPRARLSESWLRRFERLKRETAALAKDRSKSAKDRRAARDWMADRIRAGRELLDGLSQRSATLLAVARSVAARQQDYFREGADALKPLAMSQVAADVGVDESTVSRAVSGKYLRSPRGVAALRSFFVAGVSDGGGGTVSPNRIQARLRAIVAAEDPARPLSDQAVSDLLGKEGMPIARRTVVKYRELLGIPPAAERKRLAGL